MTKEDVERMIIQLHADVQTLQSTVIALTQHVEYFRKMIYSWYVIAITTLVGVITTLCLK